MTMLVTLTTDELRTLIREELRGPQSPPAAAPREVLTAEEAGELLGMHPKVVIRYTATRALPGRKVGRVWRFRRTELLQWIEAYGKDQS
jgi:excisionase family DNA binding protein